MKIAPRICAIFLGIFATQWLFAAVDGPVVDDGVVDKQALELQAIDNQTMTQPVAAEHVRVEEMPQTEGVTLPRETNASRPTLVEKLKAQEPAETRAKTPPIGNMLLGLLVVLSVIIGLAWLAKRLRMQVPGFNSQMQIIDTVMLGPREKLCLVRLEGKRMLLGVTQHSVAMLHQSEEEEKAEEGEAMFADKIKKMLQNGSPHGQ
ncbi:Flagellar protein FliO [gamma proteobacterium HdN1]|nr:Flagellar protein FliO [gamma proteobacterium HdN1]